MVWEINMGVCPRLDFENIIYLIVWGSDFIWDFGKLPFPAHLGKYIIKMGK